MIDWTNELFEEKKTTRIPMTRELLENNWETGMDIYVKL